MWLEKSRFSRHSLPRLSPTERTLPPSTEALLARRNACERKLIESIQLLYFSHEPPISLRCSPSLATPSTRSSHGIQNMGKVHGSLARAGKVKSQTPKVEPQEKKKKVCGRAKKRIIYNRRFVNVRRNSHPIAGETMLIFRFDQVTTQVGGKRRMNRS